jgi:secretion/DNA translocation related CpaE-like protein
VPFRDTPPGLLAVTTDGWIGERVAGLAAAAGISLEHRRDLPAGWSRQPDLPLVLVDPEADLAGERRPGVILICAGEPEPPVWRRAVEMGAEQVVVLPEGEPWLLDRMLDAAVPAPSAAVLGVIGGRGGAGASTLAVGLASVATRSGLRTVLLDADPLGGGLDLLVGAEREGGLRWDDLLGARGRLQPALLSSMLPTVDDLSVLSWGRRTDGFGVCPVHPYAVSAVLQSATREFDLVVVDLSRRFAEEDLPALRACRTVVVVVPSEVRAARSRPRRSVSGSTRWWLINGWSCAARPRPDSPPKPSPMRSGCPWSGSCAPRPPSPPRSTGANPCRPARVVP